MNLHRDLQIQTALNLCKQFLHSLNGRVSKEVWDQSYDVLQQIDRGLEAVQSGEGPVETNFTAMGSLNEIAGNPFASGWPAIDHQIKLIESEFNELKAGIAARDVHEVRDGIQDMLVTVYGLAWRGGFPADVDAAEVVRSNLSKFDKTLEDAEITAEKYRKIGVETYYLPYSSKHDENLVFYVTRCAETVKGTDGKEYPKHKWLKSYRFQEPVYAPLHPIVARSLNFDFSLPDSNNPASA